MFIFGRSIRRTGGYLFVILFALLSIYIIESNVNRASNSEEDLKQRDLRTKGTYHFSEKCTTVNGSQAVMVIALALKVDTVKNRDIVRRKWAVIEEECLYKILLLSKSNGNETGSDALQGDIFWYYGEMSDGKKLLHQWASEMCPHIQAVIIGERITAKSAVIQLTKLIGTGYAEDGKDFQKDFPVCSTEVLISERRKTLFVLDKQQQDDSILNALERIESEDTKVIRFLLLEKQETIVNPDQSGFMNLDRDLCNPKHNISWSPFMIIVTHSKVENFRLRQKIRKTWAHAVVLERVQAINLFILGLASSQENQDKINEERTAYGDIVQGSFPDTYRQLTSKHRSALKYLINYCSNIPYKYILKTDDDIIVDLDSITEYVRALGEKTSTTPFQKTFFCAHLVEEDRVPRNESYKWYITPEEYPGNTYPPYCYGNGYLMTRDLIPLLYNASLYTRNFWVDDVYFSGFLARNIANVTHAELPYQHPILPKLIPPEVILEKKKWLVHAWQDDEAFDAYWFAFQSRRDLSVRREFVKGVKYRTGTFVPESIFEL